MSEHLSFDAAPDPEVGAALRDALEMPFGGAFVNRVRARLAQQRARRWDEELAGWFWQGLLAASLIIVLTGWGLNAFSSADEIDAPSPTVASQLLEGTTPGVNVLLASLSTRETP